MARTAYIKDFQEGRVVGEVFVLESKSLRTTKAGKPFLTLILHDRTGQIEAKVWDDAEVINEQLAGAQFVRVNGSVESYKDQRQLKVSNLAVKRAEDVALDELMAVSEGDPDAMIEEIFEIARAVKDPHILELLRAFFKDDDFVKRFKTAPASKSIHQAYGSGLLEHTLSVLKICCMLADHYGDLYGRRLDRDLLIAGAILHDVGKVEELESGATLGYTTPGRLVGHIVLGYRMVEERIAQIEGFPQELRDQLGHLLLSHQGRLEWKSPVLPMFTEAILLHYVDDLDAKVHHVAEAIARHADPEAAFTDFDRILERFFYTQVQQPESPEKK